MHKKFPRRLFQACVGWRAHLTSKLIRVLDSTECLTQCNREAWTGGWVTRRGKTRTRHWSGPCQVRRNVLFWKPGSSGQNGRPVSTLSVSPPWLATSGLHRGLGHPQGSCKFFQWSDGWPTAAAPPAFGLISTTMSESFGVVDGVRIEKKNTETSPACATFSIF